MTFIFATAFDRSINPSAIHRAKFPFACEWVEHMLGLQWDFLAVVVGPPAGGFHATRIASR